MPPTPQHMDLGFRGAYFSRIFSAIQESAVFQEIARAAVGPDYAGQWSFSNGAQMRRLAERAGAGPGRLIADLCCGNGGPTAYIARHAGCRLVGVDWSVPAVTLARALAARENLAGQVYFAAADITRPIFRTASLDGAIDIDGFYFGVDLPWLYAEVFRVLKPGARFAFYFMLPTPTALDAIPPLRRELRERHLIDHVAALQAAGFVEARGEDCTGEFAAVVRGWSEAYSAHAAALAAEMDPSVVDELTTEMHELVWWTETHNEQRWLYSGRKPAA